MEIGHPPIERKGTRLVSKIACDGTWLLGCACVWTYSMCCVLLVGGLPCHAQWWLNRKTAHCSLQWSPLSPGTPSVQISCFLYCYYYLLTWPNGSHHFPFLHFLVLLRGRPSIYGPAGFFGHGGQARTNFGTKNSIHLSSFFNLFTEHLAFTLLQAQP